jgi:hypothetical protein
MDVAYRVWMHGIKPIARIHDAFVVRNKLSYQLARRNRMRCVIQRITRIGLKPPGSTRLCLIVRRF